LAATTLTALGAAPSAADAAALLATALVLGIRHGIDWDHIAAIADITSTTTAADAAEEIHAEEHATAPSHTHGHGGEDELRAHPGDDDGPEPVTRPITRPVTRQGDVLAAAAPLAPSRTRYVREQRHAIVLGTLYALGHALVVILLGLAALQVGAVLPDWVDPIMSRVVGITLLALGVWVFASLYQYARYGREFRLRSRWMALFDGVRYGWRWIQARLHGHEHVRPLEMSSYGSRTAFAVGMIHGIGAETGTQVLIIAAVGGAAGLGLGIPMMLAFVIGLLISNTAIVLLTSTGFATSQLRTRLYLVAGVVAGVFSLLVGFTFLTGTEGILPALERLLPGSTGA
jgi:high-affinity nickel-transport protein